MVEVCKNTNMNSGKPIGNLNEVDLDSVKTLANIHGRHSKTCASCKRTIGKEEEYVTAAEVGDVVTYCEECFYDKVQHQLEEIPIQPVFTKEVVIVMVGIFLLSTAILFIKTLWFIPPFLYVALTIDLYHMIYEAKDQMEARVLRDHYYTYGTYDLYRKKRQSIIDMIKEDAKKEDVSHLESIMNYRYSDMKATAFDVLKYDIKTFGRSILDALSYFRLTLYCMLYTYIVLIILGGFLWLSNVLN